MDADTDCDKNSIEYIRVVAARVEQMHNLGHERRAEYDELVATHGDQLKQHQVELPTAV